MLTKLDKILFVDDEVNLLSSIKRNLISQPFSSYFATSGEKALQIMNREEIKVIISDLQMPGMNGIELLDIVEKDHPDTIKIVLTGNSQLPNILATINKVRIFKYLIKPWKFAEEFMPAIEEAFQLYNSNKEKNELLQKSELIKQSQIVDPKYLISLIDVVMKTVDNINIIQSISRKLPFMSREILEKLSVDIYTRTDIMKSDLELVNLIIKAVISQENGGQNENLIHR